MNRLSEWWGTTEKSTVIIQVLTFLILFTITTNINNAFISIPLGAAGLFIGYDCIRKKGLKGFFLPKKDWLGIAVFLLSVLTASVFSGDVRNVYEALNYVYWATTFLIMVYFGNHAGLKYPVIAGTLASVAVTFAGTFYLACQKAGAVNAARIGAFSGNVNHFSVLLIGILPVLFCVLSDKELSSNKKFVFLDAVVIVMGLFSLWKTGSRGAMAGFFLASLVILAVFCFINKKPKLFLAGLAACFALVFVFLSAGIPGGAQRHGDRMRMRQLQSCYAMWKDHMATGVGLKNWRSQYKNNYLLADDIRKDALERYAVLKARREQRAAERRKLAQQQNAQKAVKAESGKKPLSQAAKKKLAARRRALRRKAAKREAARKAAFVERVFRKEANLPQPHNVVAWFFSTTGVIGGAGYLFFAAYYLILFCRKLKDDPEGWAYLAALWTFLAINIHGLADAGITNKAAARLVYLMMGFALTYYARRAREKDEKPDAETVQGKTTG